VKKYLPDNRGIALILVLMIISIIVVVTLDFHTDMRSEFTAAANVRDGIMLRYLAKSGFNLAMAILAKDAEDDENPCDTLREYWANTEAVSAGSSMLPNSEGRITVDISDCSAKIQINSLVTEKGGFDHPQKMTLERFLNLPEFELDEEMVKSMVDSIKDWIDADDDETDFGAENSYYQAQDAPYACENGPIRAISSIRKVKGFADIPQEIFDKITDQLTIYGDGKININTADLPVLQSLSDGITPALAEDIITHRQNETNDLCASSWYKDVPGMNVEQIPPDLITLKSSFFEISSAATVDVQQGTISLTKYVKGVVNRKDEKKGIDLIYWQID
jgi:general secretion pathway protein K